MTFGCYTDVLSFAASRAFASILDTGGYTHRSCGRRRVEDTHSGALPRIEALQAAVLARDAHQPVRRAQPHL
jgi:hypothetical protein